MGLKKIQVTREWLGQTLKGTKETETNVPDDAEIVRIIDGSPDKDTYWFLVESDEWEETPEGTHVEEFVVEVEEVTDDPDPERNTEPDGYKVI